MLDKASGKRPSGVLTRHSVSAAGWPSEPGYSLKPLEHLPARDI
jgi:hypothetical protein